VAAARGDQAREAYKCTGYDARRREPDERRDERRGEQGSAIGVAHRPLLGHGFGEYENNDDFERRGDRHADWPEYLGSYNAHERGGDQLAEQDEQKDRRQEVSGSSTSLRKDRAPRWLSSSSDLARALEVRVSPVSASERTAEQAISTKTATSTAASAPVKPRVEARIMG